MKHQTLRYRPLLAALLVLAIGACGGDSTSPDICDPSDPLCTLSIVSVAPVNGATNVTLTTTVTVTFSQAVDPASVTSSTFRVGTVAGTISVNGATATFTPASPLDEGVTLAVTVQNVRTAAGIALTGQFNSSFTTWLSPLGAHAGEDQDVAVSSLVQLDGTGSTGTGATLTWTQLYGPAVGALSGARPEFTAPADVSTLVFELRVARGGDAMRDTVRIWVLEDPANQYWVRPNGDNANPGTRARPFNSVQAAIDAAHAAGRRGDVYVAAGTYTYVGSLMLRPGVSVYGGFHPVTWLRDIEAHRPTIQGGSYAVAGLQANDLTLEGLRIVAADNTLAGGGSAVLQLHNSRNARVRGNVLEAGAGRAGADGGNGANGSNGSNGSSGANSGGGTNAGGAGGSLYNAGGRGGNGVLGNSPPGERGYGPGGGSAGAGGSLNKNGGHAGSATADGAPGTNGVAGLAIAPIVGDPANGGAGQTGQNGSGGGGGGGGGGSGVASGAAGGGGGGGGQGGGPGIGGGGGGGSFGIILSGTTSAEVVDNRITTKNGGNGGRGGTGGAGGARGAQGAGGSGTALLLGSGGWGGHGSAGGRGGHGGGGGGGPSIGIVETGSASAELTRNTISIGAAGTGGQSSGNPGANGMAAPHLKR
jgi:hypothetical protein